MMKRPSRIEIFKISHLTNGMEIFKAPEGSGVELAEFTPSSVILTLEKPRAAEGQLVALQGTVTLASGSASFGATGKIVRIESLPSQISRLEIALRQYDQHLWRSFLDAKAAEQNHVDLLFARIKGTG